MPDSVPSTDKVAIRGKELSQALRGSVVSHKEKIVLLQEQVHEQYSASKCTGHLMVT